MLNCLNQLFLFGGEIVGELPPLFLVGLDPRFEAGAEETPHLLFLLEPRECQYVVPYPVGKNDVTFTLEADRIDPAAVYSVRAIDADGKIYRSAPFYPQKLSGKKADIAAVATCVAVMSSGAIAAEGLTEAQEAVAKAEKDMAEKPKK